MTSYLLILKYRKTSSIKETTASLVGATPMGIMIYWTPKLNPQTNFQCPRPGRAVDICELECILLEIASVLIAPPDYHVRILDLIRSSRTESFGRWEMHKGSCTGFGCLSKDIDLSTYFVINFKVSPIQGLFLSMKRGDF